MSPFGVDYFKKVYSKPTETISFDVDRIARLRFVLQAVGEDINWSTVLSPNGDGEYGFVLPVLNNDEISLWASLLDAHSPRDSKLRKLYQERMATLGVNAEYNSGLFRGPDYAVDVGAVTQRELCDKLINFGEAQ